jgi:hypothetical protein
VEGRPIVTRTDREEGGVAETEGSEGSEGFYTCERCGKVKSTTEACACGKSGEPVVPEGWDPELTGGSRPRLSIVSRERSE